MEADQGLAGAAALLPLEDVAADEVFGEVDEAVKAGFDGGGVLVEFVAVEGEAGFGAEDVAGAEAAGGCAGGGQGLP